jgi:hypothetical protein
MGNANNIKATVNQRLIANHLRRTAIVMTINGFVKPNS